MKIEAIEVSLYKWVKWFLMKDVDGDKAVMTGRLYRREMCSFQKEDGYEFFLIWTLGAKNRPSFEDKIDPIDYEVGLFLGGLWYDNANAL